MTDLAKTKSIEMNIEAIKELRVKNGDLDERLREVEVGHGQTVVYCKNIIENQHKTEEVLKEVCFGIKSLTDTVNQIKLEAVIEKTQSKTRWDILGKPIAALIVASGLGGGLVSWLINVLKGAKP